MDNETTRLINDEAACKEQVISTPQSETKATQPESTKKGSSVKAAAGGFVAGAAAGAAATAVASDSYDETASAIETPEGSAAEEILETPEEPAAEETLETPTPEQAILANDEGIRYAHVEADTFSDAFAQARDQVGPGGVFEYNGKIYSTYIAEEWNGMSAEERADYQARVNEVAPARYTKSHTAGESYAANEPAAAGEPYVAEHHEAASDVVPADAQMISAEPVDSEIKVLGVEAVQNADGHIMNVALVECEGDQALLVDVDNNGTIDVLIHDDNIDGEIQGSEIHDISDSGLEVAHLMQAQAAQQGDVLYASNDDMPDYINDADSTINV